MRIQISGFLLTGTAIDRDDTIILKLYGQSDIGAFCVTINNLKNYFFVESKTPTSITLLMRGRMANGAFPGASFFFRPSTPISR